MRILNRVSLFLFAVGFAGQAIAKPRVHITPSFYSDLVRYTEFSAAALVINLGKDCPQPPSNSVVVETIVEKKTNTQLTIFRDDDAEEFIVSFPGTSSVQDFGTDFRAKKVPYVSPGVNCPGCMAHNGFLTSYNSIAADLQTALDKYTAQYPSYMVTPTGHSLGGALAALAYPSLQGLGYPVTLAYTFGQPRIGDQATADYIDSLSGASNADIGQFRRTTHTFDGVPQLPTLKMGYRHPRTEFFELDTKSGNQSARRTFRCFGQEALDCNRGMGRGFINSAHLMYSGVSMVGNEGCGM